MGYIQVAEETEAYPWQLVLVDTGGVFGMYMGISLVGAIEALIFIGEAFLICCCRRRTSPSTHPGIRHTGPVCSSLCA